MKKSTNKNFNYFLEHHDEIFKNYPNMFVIIHDEEVFAGAPTFDEALNKAINGGLELGSFLIQECTDGEEGYTQTFHSRIVFA